MNPAQLNNNPDQEAAIQRFKLAVQEARAAVPANRQSAIGNPQLLQVVRPAARDRWMGSVASQMTPQRVDQILRSALTGNLVAQWEIFDLMEDTSPRIQKNLNEVKRSVLAYVRTVEPWSEEDEPATPEAEKRAKVVSRALWTMKPRADENQNGFDETIYDILDAWGKGLALLEIDWEVRPAGKLGFVTAPQATRWIHPRYYGFPANGDWLGLNVSEINQTRSAEHGVRNGASDPQPSTLNLQPVDGIYARIPPNKFLVCKCKARTGHPSVTALLRPLAFWWCASNFTQQWFLSFAQIFGVPIRWANYDPNVPGLVDKVCDMLENMGSDAWGAFPAGTTLELKEPMKAGTDNPQISLLDRAERNYDILILGQTLTTDVAASGSRALGQVHKTVRDDIVIAAAGFVMRVFNEQLIPMIELLNFDDNSLTPELCLEEAKIEDTKANAETLKIASDIGVHIPSKHASKKLGIPLATEDDEILEPRAMASPSPGGEGRGEGEPAFARSAQTARAKADDQLVTNVLEDLTGVEARWLGGVKPFFHRLIAAAKSGQVSDAEFTATLERAQREMPELFNKLDTAALAESLENAMATAVLNGAVRGALKRIGNRPSAIREGVPA